LDVRAKKAVALLMRLKKGKQATTAMIDKVKQPTKVPVPAKIGKWDTFDDDSSSLSASYLSADDRDDSAGSGVDEPLPREEDGRVPTDAASSSSALPPCATRAAPGDRSWTWGGFVLADIHGNEDGKQIGCGATCYRHKNSDDIDTKHPTSCKKFISFGQKNLSRDECILRLKRWLVAGMDDARFDKDWQRRDHVQMGGRVQLSQLADGLSEAELDAIVG
jgi:hypothetical protein